MKQRNNISKNNKMEERANLVNKQTFRTDAIYPLGSRGRIACCRGARNAAKCESAAAPVTDHEDGNVGSSETLVTTH
jgi:hypothetical protein